jgi:hypothetical protein
MARQHLGGERIQNTSRGVEDPMDEGPHPPRLYPLVDRIDGHEAARVGAVVVQIVDHLEAPGYELDAAAALYLT